MSSITPEQSTIGSFSTLRGGPSRNANVEIQEAEAAAAASLAVNNAQIDIADYLNIHSA